MLIPPNHYFYELEKKKKLGKILNVDSKFFRNVDSNFFAQSFYQPSSGKKQRLLHEPKNNYKRILKRINRLLLLFNIPSHVYSGIPRRSFLDNAMFHRHSSYVQNIDIQNFFPNTHEHYVFSFFKNKCLMSPDVAKILTLLTTYPDNTQHEDRSLPQGFPTSNVLSFLAYFDMFNGIHKLARQKNIHFTIFVDDMTFSSENRIPKSFLNQVSSIIRQYGLNVHPHKTKYYGFTQPKSITGAIIDPFSNELKLPNKIHESIYRNLTAIHNLSIGVEQATLPRGVR